MATQASSVEEGNPTVTKETHDKCYHLIRHVKTDEEKEQIRMALGGARSLGDMGMVMLYVEMLTGECHD